MKKLLTILVMLICLLALTACDPGVNSLDADELLSNTVKIELVQYENENPKLLQGSAKDKSVFNFDKVTPIATLDESRFEDVAKDIAQ